ncbi:MAG: DUF4129 domain-containing protein [Planctomycetota bacterium]|jgi:hypothetical protein|nr:DUF4129 domain-containing protein [Planctomycetota bacterium]
MNFGRAQLLSLLLFAVRPCGGGALSAGDNPGPAELRRLLAEIVGERNLQTEFPSRPDSRAGHELPIPEGHEWPAPGGSGLGGIANYTLWIAAAVFAAILLATILDNRFRKQRFKSGPRKKDGANGEAGRVGKRRETAKLESDALAEAGDYAGAVHVILLQSLEEIRRRLGLPLEISLTSREILGRIGTGLEPAARASLEEIVSLVEVSWFGTHRPDAGDYAKCRRSFRTIANVLGGKGAA